MKTLLSGGVVVTCDEEHTVYNPGDVLIDGEAIAFVGASYDGEYDVRRFAGGKLVMPGLINAHTHSGMSIFRGLSDDVDLRVFLEERVWPREVRLTPEDVLVGSRLSAIEMLKCGVTTYVDMYFFEDALVEAALEVGSRVLVTQTILATPQWEQRLGSWEQQLARGSEFVRSRNGEAGRIHLGFGPHAPYTVPLEALQAIAEEARALDVPVNTHLVETAWEREEFNRRGLGSTVRALDDVGFFEGKTLAAHSIWLDPGDIDIFHQRGVGIAHCPQSNAKLGAGIAPLAAMLMAAVNVGIGTDGAATNNNLDLWEDMRLAPMLAKAMALDPKPVPARVALWLATRLGARAVHLPNIGVLREGNQADVIELTLDDTTMVPVFDSESFISHLVYSAGRHLVDTVWVNGQQVVRAGAVLLVDEAEARRSAQRTALGLSERALA